MVYDQPLVSIITVNYNETPTTIELLDSIKQNSYSNYEIIVVDNASIENPKQAIVAHHPDVKLILSQTNLGFAGGNNLGIKDSNGEFLLFINNDAVLTDGTIENLVSTFSEKPDAGIVSPKFHFYNKENIIEYAGYTDINAFTGRNKTIGQYEQDKGQYDQLRETHFCHGGGMMVSRKAMDKVGLMPEAYFLYYEELDWCEMFKRAGYKIYIQPKALIRHKVSVSIGQNSTLKTYYLTRNRLLFMRRNKTSGKYFLFLIFVFIFTIPKNQLKYLLRGEFDHAKVFIKAIVWNFGFKKLGAYK